MKSLMLTLMLGGLMTLAILPVAVHAATASGVLGGACAHLDIAGCASGSQGLNTKGASGTTYLQDLIDTFLYAAGIVAIIFVIIGGIRYITSTGDSARIKSAKDTLLYAIIGLIVVILALPIVAYVLSTLNT